MYPFMYKEEVSGACRWRDEAMMKEEMGKMKEKKMRTMYFQNLEMKEYVKKGTLYEARKTWEVRSHMLDLAGNFPGHKKYEQSDWKCQACNQQVREDQEHVTHCEGYEDLKEDADLTNEEELVQFFIKVMQRRHEMNWD